MNQITAVLKEVEWIYLVHDKGRQKDFPDSGIQI